MKKFLIMVISLFFIFIIAILFVSMESKITNKNSVDELYFDYNSISVELGYDSDNNGIFLSFFNNSNTVQYVPIVFIDLFKRVYDENYYVVNNEISITDANGLYVNYLVVMIDINLENLTRSNCYEIQPQSYFKTQTIPVNKIVDVKDLSGKILNFQYDGRFGKSNIVSVLF